jgi:glycosyltransferase involved in cell wall biosynthesis
MNMPEQKSVKIHTKIAINATSAVENPTGLGVYTQELLNELLKAEYDFTVYASSNDLKRLCPDKVKQVSFRTSPSLGFRGHLARLLWLQTGLPLKLWRQKPSLLYSTVPEGIMLPFPKQKQIITVLDTIPAKYPELHPKMKYHYFYDLPILLKNTQWIICISENTKKDVIHYYRMQDKPISVIYPGYDRKKFYARTKGEVARRYGLSKYLLYVGDIRPYKNLERNLEAFARLNLRDFKLVIGGKKDTRYYSKLERKVNQLSLKDKVIFWGYVSGEDLPHLYSEASALVFPSLYEGFGLPPLEAMACGCPVIVSKTASLPEVCGEAAYYVDPHSVESIAGGISKVLNDESLRDTMIQKGFERVKLFSWENAANKVLKVFEEVLK